MVRTSNKTMLLAVGALCLVAFAAAPAHARLGGARRLGNNNSRLKGLQAYANSHGSWEKDLPRVAYTRDGWNAFGTMAQLGAAWCAKTWETYDILRGHRWGSLKAQSPGSDWFQEATSYWRKLDCDRVQAEADWCQKARRQHFTIPFVTRGTASDSDMAKWNELDCNTKATWQDLPTLKATWQDVPTAAGWATGHPQSQAQVVGWSIVEMAAHYVSPSDYGTSWSIPY